MAANVPERRRRGQQKQAHDHRQPHGAVVLIHRGGVGAVGIGGDDQHRPLPRFQRLAVEGADVVIHLHDLALVLAGLHLRQQELLAPLGAIGHFVHLGVVRQNVGDDGGLILGVVVAPRQRLVDGGGRRAQNEKQHHARQQHDAAQAVFAPPRAEAGQGGGVLGFFHGEIPPHLGFIQHIKFPF